MEVGSHWLCRSDALRVGTADEAPHLYRQADLALLDDLVVSDDVDVYFRGKEGDLIDLLGGEEVVCELNDPLTLVACAL